MLLPLLATDTLSLAISSLIAGAFTPGIVPLALGRIHALLPQDTIAQRASWSTATTSFALLQTAGARALTFVFTQAGGDFRLLFLIGAAAPLLALAIDLIAGPRPSRLPAPSAPRAPPPATRN